MRRCVEHKGPLGASVTYCNISCFNLIWMMLTLKDNRVYVCKFSKLFFRKCFFNLIWILLTLKDNRVYVCKFSKLFFRKCSSKLYHVENSETRRHTVWTQMRWLMMSHLIWIYTVCKCRVKTMLKCFKSKCTCILAGSEEVPVCDTAGISDRPHSSIHDNQL